MAKRLGYKIWVDTSDLDRGKREVRKIYQDMTKEAEKSSDRIDEVFRKAGKAATAVFSIAAAKRFASQIIEVRGEMQMLESSFDTLLGSSTKAAEMINSIKDYAVQSPLSVSGISKAAQMLLGFNVEAEKIIPVIKQIGDISMGSQDRFQSLTLAFAQMSSVGKLMGQDLLQMINAGFNPLSEISLKTGKSIADLKDEMASGAISAEMVADAFRSATDAGGRFHGMTQKQADGIKGLQAQLQGAWQDMFNDLGESQEGFISSGYRGLILLAQNYEKVGKVIASIAATYGTYKAAVIAVTLAERGWTIASMTKYRWLLLVERAQKLLNATMLKNPYVLAATAAVGLITTLIALRDTTTDLERAQNRLNEGLDELNTKQAEQREEIERLISVIRDETETQLEKVKAYEALKILSPALTNAYNLEAIAVAELTEQTKLLNEERDRERISFLDSRIARLEDIKKQMEGAGSWWDLNLTEDERKTYRGQPLRNAVKEVNLELENALEERRKIEELINKSTETVGEEIITKNKSYWEQQKKEAENALAQLTDESTAKEWKDARKRVADAQKELDKYSVSTKTKQTDDLEKEAEEIYNAQLDVEDARIRAMTDGYEKEVARVNFIHQQRLDQIKRRAKDLTDEQQHLMTMYADAERDGALKILEFTQTETIKKEIQEDQAAWNRYLQEYGDYQEKRLGITREYEQKIADAQNGGEKALLQKEMENALKDLDFENLKATIDFEKIFSNIDEHNTAALRILRNKIALYLEQAADSLTPEQLKVLSDAFQNIDLTIRNRDPFGSVIDSVRKYRKALVDLKGAQDAGFAPEQLQKFSDAASAAMLTVASNIETATNKAKEFTDILTGAMSSVGMGTAASDVNNFANVAFGAVQAGTGIARVFAGDLSGIKDAAKGLAQVATSIVAINDSAKEREIVKLQGKVDALSKSYDKLGKALDTAYSKSAVKLLRDQEKALKQREALIRMQIKEEEAKKNTDKNRIKAWNDELDGIREGLEDIEISAVDAVMGADVKAAIDDFAKAYTDAWAAGEDKMMSVKDATKKMIQGVISEMVKDNMTDAVKQFREKLSEAIKDDYISESEEDELNAIMESIVRDNERKFGWADRFMKEASSGNSGQGAASYGAYEKITQDQASSIDGRLTGIFQEAVMQRSALGDISANTSKLTVIAENFEELKATSLNCWGELVAIKDNTKLLNDTNKLLENIHANTKGLKI